MIFIETRNSYILMLFFRISDREQILKGTYSKKKEVEKKYIATEFFKLLQRGLNKLRGQTACCFLVVLCCVVNVYRTNTVIIWMHK
jgi:hypothetical protein